MSWLWSILGAIAKAFFSAFFEAKEASHEAIEVQKDPTISIDPADYDELRL